AFVKFDESKVKEFGMTMFAGLSPELESNALYPENRSWKYPKAGEANSKVSVHVYHIENGKTVDVNVGEEIDQYIPRIRWTQSSDVLSVFRLNRLQNKFDLLFANPVNGESKVAYSEENKYYIDEVSFDNLTFLEDGKHFVWTSEMDGWNHIYLLNMEGEIVRQLTKGNFDVTDFIGFDTNKKVFYYQAAKESPLRREIYSVRLNGKKDHKISEKSGTNKASFSKSYKYFINYFSNAQTPLTVTLHNSKGQMIRELKNNNSILEKLSDYNYSLKEFFTFTTSEKVELNGYMIKPVGFDPDRKYPVMMTQYSGPNSQSCADDWDFGWENYLAQEGFIVVCIDGRGTAARGEEFRKCTYLQLGRYESDDQIEGAKYLSSLPYVDQENISIWGWSFGGFMVSLSMTKSDVFKAGVAVAPVTNWRYYDNIYTERFMRTPQENPEGYDQNSPLYFADKLSGKLLLIHGSADDNVHVQNTMEFIERLVQADKQFDMMLYTNRNHSIYGKNTRFHLFQKMTNFLKENLMED
ncbi:MAG: DPP IV N-terminal domain-containing protein, partial [Bacteroidales bacterium]|nr:DPP IV N-terminal domain-containing protein [Bacteroidales bacterium]